MGYFGIPFRNGVPIGLGSVASFGAQQFDPSSLFIGGTAGAWYDPSDLSTLFTTSAGTTQCAMPGQGSAVSVGLMLDKSQNGVGTNGAKRVNLLRWSEVFDATASGSAWINAGVTVTDGVLAPNGTNTADTITGATGAYPHVRQAITLPAAGTYKASCYFQKTSGATRFPALEVYFAPGNAMVVLNTDTGVAANAQGTPTNISVSDAGGYWLVSFDVAVNITSATFYIYPASSSNGTSLAPNLTGSCVAWGADLRLASEAATLPLYQPITSSWYATMAGNHAIAFNDTTARPELRARVNLITNSENFAGTGWSGTVTVATDVTTAPNGTTTADSITAATTATFRYLRRSPSELLANVQFTWSVSAKKNTADWVTLRFWDTNPGTAAWFNLATGAIGTVQAGCTASISNQGNGWYRCSITRTIGATVAFNETDFQVSSGDNTNNANAGDSVFLWGADLRPTNIGANVPAYQRIADANTYDTSGFPLYLRFDGVDDSMYTPASINFSGTDKMSVFAGVRKLSDAAQGAVAELSATIASNNGAFLLSAPNSAAANYNFSSKGTTQVDNTVITYAAPNTAVLSGTADITAPSNILRVNAVQAGSVGTSQGTGNFGTYPLYIGSRNNASLRFNGHLYSLAVVGSAVSAGNISATEQWVANKTGIVI